MDWKWWTATIIALLGMIAAWLAIPSDASCRWVGMACPLPLEPHQATLPRSETPPSSIDGCVIYNDTRTLCLRCEFPITERDAGQVWHSKTCAPMPREQRVKVRFVGSYEASRGPGSDCWLAEFLKGADGKVLNRVDHTNVASCEVDIDRTSDFVLPELPSRAEGAIRIGQCQWGGDAGRQCRLTGTLSIFAESAEH